VSNKTELLVSTVQSSFEDTWANKPLEDRALLSVLEKLRFQRGLAGVLFSHDAKEGRVRDTTALYFERIKKEIGGKVECSSGPEGGVKLTLHCEEGHDVEWSSPNRIPPEGMASKLKRLGWRFGRHLRCPEHVRRQKDPEGQIPARRPEKGRSDDMRGKLQAGPVSDASIAEDCGVSAEVVVRLREELYGELKEPVEIEQVQLEIEQTKAKFEQAVIEMRGAFLDRVAALQGRIDGLAKANGWRK
jgi:hypothetical protein